MPLDHPDRAMCLYNLGLKFGNRYNETSSIRDLEQAIAYTQEAVTATPPDHPEQAMYLSNLGIMLGNRYSLTGSMDDLERAIAYAQEAVRATSLDDSKRAMYLNNLGLRLGNRYSLTGSMDDLERAIAYAQEAVIATPLDHPDRAVCLNSLGLRLGDKYSVTGRMDDLEQAITYAQEAVITTPLDHPDRAGYLNSLGLRLGDRYSLTNDKEDDERSMRVFEDGVKCSTSLPLIRIRSGRNAIRILRRYSRWEDAAAIVETLFGLLPYICDRYMSRGDQQHILKQASGLAADACSISLKMNNPHQALQRIEFGRALILEYLMVGRSDISELTMSHPDLAREYEELRFRALGKVDLLDDDANQGSRLQERRDAPRLMADCERRIRDQPGFEHFLQPAPVHELMQSAEEGPVIFVNCTDISSDAIIVFTSTIEVIPLPSMSLEPPKSFEHALERHKAVEQRDYQHDIKSDVSYQHDVNLLSWLWLTCVSPILQKVAARRAEKRKDRMPRIWWIGTGSASSLPFHAAGNYGYSIPSDLDNCLSQCISSHILSIKSLKHARMTASRASKSFTQKSSLLVVTMPTTPGHAALAGAALEGDAIQGVIGQKWAIKSLRHPAASDVLNDIRAANMVHFACHGSFDPADPMASHLLLRTEDANKDHVDKLTVSALLDATIQQQVWVAYLSTGSTTEVRSHGLSDESLHLTSVFQMAGFAHIIGTLGTADDQICVQVARLFYSFLVDNEDCMDLNRVVPEALNYAIRQILKERPNDSDLWAPFIHLGA
jgi:tetratricopeptide (TPR) repeat protein